MLDPTPQAANANYRKEVRRARAPTRYLETTGWLKSVEQWAPVDVAGTPLPWYTYPCIAFLAPRIQPHWSVFEYGSGYSTIWWARRVKTVAAVEHSDDWVGRVRAMLPGNASVDLQTGDDYVAHVGSKGMFFHVVIIDGAKDSRVACSRVAVNHLTADGVIVWDNTDISRHRRGAHELKKFGFRCLDFEGLGPQLGRGWCTSILYRDGNCLGI